jgi:hypothetical protein
MIVSKTNDKSTEIILWVLWSMFLFLIIKANILVGIGVIIFTIMLYLKVTYKVIFREGYFEIKYLNRKTIINYQSVSHIFITPVSKSLGLSLFIITKPSGSQNFSFGYGDSDNLVLILNYLIKNEIKILDKRDCLSKYVRFENNIYIKKGL